MATGPLAQKITIFGGLVSVQLYLPELAQTATETEL